MKRLLLAVLLLFTTPALASDGGAQHIQFGPFFDSAGTLYPSVKIYHYSTGTTTLKNCWSDENKVTTVAQPFVGDTSGVARMFCDGDYKFKIDDTDDNTLYTWDTFKVTSDTGPMWEGNAGTSYPTAATANRWQVAVKHTAGNVFQELGINNGSSFQTLVQMGGADINYLADAGSTDAYAVSFSPAITAYTAGLKVHFYANTLNTGNATLNVDSLGAKTITKEDNANLNTGDILATQIVSVIYDGANFQMVSPQSNIAYEDRANVFTQNQKIHLDSSRLILQRTSSSGSDAGILIYDQNAAQAMLIWYDWATDKWALDDSSSVTQFSVDMSTGDISSESVATASIDDDAVTPAKIAGYAASVVNDLGSIAANRETSFTQTVTGAGLGDFAWCSTSADLSASLHIQCKVSATDQVTVQIANTSGGAIDPASVTWYMQTLSK